MKSWPTKPLSELLLTLETGSRPKGGVGEIPDGIPSVSGEHINRKGEFYWDTPKHISRDFYAGMKRGRIQRGDILVVKDGATTGKTAMVRDNFPFKEAAINEHVFLLRTDRAKVLPEYAGFFLFGPVGQQQILSSFRGSAIGGIAQDFVQKVHIPLAPLVEQERIVKLLDEADQLRKLRAQADHRAAALIPALFNEMFGDPAANPKNWPLLHVGELIEACDYGTSQKSNEENRGVPVLRMGNVTTKGVLDLQDLKTVELTESELVKQRLQVGDVLFNRTNSRELVGKTGMWDGRFEAVPASYFIRLRFRSNVEHPQHFTTFMNLPFMKRKLAEMARGAVGQANINSKELKSIVVPTPPFELQKEFAKRVKEIRELEGSQVNTRTRLDTLFQSMLHRAFNGEL